MEWIKRGKLWWPVVAFLGSLYLAWLTVWGDWKSEASFQRGAVAWTLGGTRLAMNVLVLLSRAVVLITAISILVISVRSAWRTFFPCSQLPFAWRNPVYRRQIMGMDAPIAQPTESSVRSADTPPIVDDSELILIQHYRAFWIRFGNEAFRRMDSLFEMVITKLENEEQLAPLLRGPLAHMRTTKNDFHQMMTAYGADPTLDEVRKAWDAAYTAYMVVCAWAARLKERTDVPQIIFSNNSRLDRWYDSQRALNDKLYDLSTVPEHGGKLWVHDLFFDDVVARFMAPTLAQPGFRGDAAQVGTSPTKSATPVPSDEARRRWISEIAAAEDPLSTTAYAELRPYLPEDMRGQIESRTIAHTGPRNWNKDRIIEVLTTMEQDGQ